MKLRDWRRARGMNVEAVAAMVGVTTGTVYGWEQGRTVPKKNVLKAIVAKTDGAVTANDFHEGQRAA